jgi:hypothetical protein
MLLALAGVLVVCWVIALAFKVTFGLIHVLLVAALILFALHFVRSRVGPPRPGRARG